MARKPRELKCEVCSKIYKSYKDIQRFCSNKCRAYFNSNKWKHTKFEDKKFSLDLIANRFHRILVIKRVENPTNKINTRSYWLIKCDCGAEKIMTAARIRRSKSCGCYKKEGSYAPKGINHSQWKGGFHYNGGYKFILNKKHPNAKKSGYIAEHIFVMSEFLQRPLLKTEVVHHKNGIKDDNRIENLELWSHSHPSGQRIEDKIKWCLEFIKLYSPERSML